MLDRQRIAWLRMTGGITDRRRRGARIRIMRRSIERMDSSAARREQDTGADHRRATAGRCKPTQLWRFRQRDAHGGGGAGSPRSSGAAGVAASRRRESAGPGIFPRIATTQMTRASQIASPEASAAIAPRIGNHVRKQRAASAQRRRSNGNARDGSAAPARPGGVEQFIHQHRPRSAEQTHARRSQRQRVARTAQRTTRRAKSWPASPRAPRQPGAGARRAGRAMPRARGMRARARANAVRRGRVDARWQRAIAQHARRSARRRAHEAFRPRRPESRCAARARRAQLRDERRPRTRCGAPAAATRSDAIAIRHRDRGSGARQARCARRASRRAQMIDEHAQSLRLQSRPENSNGDPAVELGDADALEPAPRVDASSGDAVTRDRAPSSARAIAPATRARPSRAGSSAQSAARRGVGR
ncbi:MAG: hypothetical protein WDW36_008298 [Sanguina aurantia]